MKSSDQAYASLTQVIDTKTKSHVHKQMFVALGCLAVLVVSAPACDADALGQSGEQELPQPSEEDIEVLQAFGAGCPNIDSTPVDIASDRRSFLVIFEDMLLQNPGGSPLKTINCVVSVKLHVPSGWQVALTGIHTRGYAFLEKGIKARDVTHYLFAGNPVGHQYRVQLVGPYDDLYVISDQIPFESVLWSRCGTSPVFTIEALLVLNALANPDGVGIMNVATPDGRFRKELQLQWRKC